MKLPPVFISAVFISAVLLAVVLLAGNLAAPSLEVVPSRALIDQPVAIRTIDSIPKVLDFLQKSFAEQK